MNNKIKITALLFFSLLVVAVIVFFTQKREKDTFSSVEFTQFAVENSREVIGRIFLADRENNLALLERQNDGSWKYINKGNGKKFNANPNAINNLLETFEKVRVRNRVPNPSVKTVLRGIATIGVKVELYNKSNKKIRTFYIGGPADGGKGTFAVMDGSDVPYVLNIPNFEGTIDSRFNAKEEALRDRAIVRHNPKDLEKIQVEYFSPEQRPYSFKIDLNKEESVEQLFNNQKLSTGKPKKEYLDIYLDDFKVLSSEKIIYDKNIRDSVVKTSPFAKISFKYKSKKETKVMTLYPLINSSFDRGDGRPGIREKILRYYVDLDEDNFYLTQDLVMKKLLRPYEYFFEEIKGR
jgi:hypothetical protein